MQGREEGVGRDQRPKGNTEAEKKIASFLLPPAKRLIVPNNSPHLMGRLLDGRHSIDRPEFRPNRWEFGVF